ncbi:MAG: Flp/Fap pilin component [Gemmatimonadota bacterium]
MTIKTTLKRFLADESGASMVEYALLLGVVVAVVLGAMNLLGADVATKMEAVGDAIIAAP